MNPNLPIWGVAGLAIAGVILRPWGLPEAIWVVAGALLLVAGGLLPATDAVAGLVKGTDVYFFLSGIMLLAELARKEGLFHWLAALTTNLARGSATGLFTLVYFAGTVVTVFLSNDTTAVVLTPAVAAAAKAAKVRNPLPYLLICAMVANAASFALPISNPANLILFGAGRVPPVVTWMTRFAVPCLAAVITTYLVLLGTQRSTLAAENIRSAVTCPKLTASSRLAGLGILATTAVVITASALGYELGFATFVAGASTAIAVATVSRHAPWALVSQISWGVLPLVAGLFVLVEALESTGVLRMLADTLRYATALAETQADWWGALIAALASNVLNNLPTGLLAGAAVTKAQASPRTSAAILIGVDIGPNLSVTGSLATILWLTALRREGLTMSAWQFLKVGALVMPTALIAAIGSLMLLG